MKKAKKKIVGKIDRISGQKSTRGRCDVRESSGPAISDKPSIFD